MPAMDCFKRYTGLYGLPSSVYIDRHTTYKSNAKPTIADDLLGRKPMSQFESYGNACSRSLTRKQPSGKGEDAPGSNTLTATLTEAAPPTVLPGDSDVLLVSGGIP